MKQGLLLAPGAGADSESPALLAVEALLATKFAVRRMDFPYRKAGRKAPDRAPVLLQAVLDEASDFAAISGLASENIYLGGRSMGGRICSMAVAEGLPAAGLVLLSYPLHPPGRPEKLRTEHFENIDVPCLFVSGTHDAFGTPAEFKRAINLIPAEVQLDLLEGGDHGMAKYNDDVAPVVAEWLASR